MSRGLVGLPSRTCRTYRVGGARAYNLRRREVKFKVDDFVFRNNHAHSNKANYEAAKLAPKKIGPSKINKIVSPTNKGQMSL